jgi:Uma2 family endonuclease
MVTLPVPQDWPVAPNRPRELSGGWRFTPEHFAELCTANRDAVLELTAESHLIERTPTGGETGHRDIRLSAQLQTWTHEQRRGISALHRKMAHCISNGARLAGD